MSPQEQAILQHEARSDLARQICTDVPLDLLRMLADHDISLGELLNWITQYHAKEVSFERGYKQQVCVECSFSQENGLALHSGECLVGTIMDILDGHKLT